MFAEFELASFHYSEWRPTSKCRYSGRTEITYIDNAIGNVVECKVLIMRLQQVAQIAVDARQYGSVGRSRPHILCKAILQNQMHFRELAVSFFHFASKCVLFIYRRRKFDSINERERVLNCSSR